MSLGWRLLTSGIYGGPKKKNKGMDMITPEPYAGARPYSGAEVGYGSGELSSLASAYLPELKRKATGEGLVGFDPRRRDLLRSEYLQDFNEYESDVMKKASAQASGQGLRGGIPSSIASEYTKNLSRSRQSGLNEIDIEDLEARREDINRAFYQQPEEISRGSGIQQNRAAFDLGVYQAEQPTYIEPQQSNVLPALIGAAGTGLGAYFGGPGGAAGGNALAQAFLANQYGQPPAAQSPARRYNYQDPLLTQGGYGYRKPY